MLRAGRQPIPALGLVVVSTLLASACASPTSQSGSVPTSTANPQQSSFPLSVKAANGEVRIGKRPDRIVSLSPTATEMLFAIGAGDQVVAVDDNSNYPPQAPMTELSAYQPNVEAVAKYSPDLVVISDDLGIVKSLGKLSIPVMLEPAAKNLDDTYAQIEQLGAATGHVADAVRLVASMKSEIQHLVASAPDFDHPLIYYHELDQTYYTATSSTFIGQIYGLLGLRNIADEAKGAASGYPQLSAEYIIKADPDVIFLADTKCCGQSAATVAKRPGWDQIAAVKDGAVVSLDDDVASRWGPRVVDLLLVVEQALSRLHERVGA
ncbi:MAG TPA: ABC transporter substrate-binding protein [Actinomycetota bacterium]|jgi:iron complex transport system substrate-binding protein